MEKPTYIYKMIRDEKIVYVGISVNPKVRSRAHGSTKRYDSIEISPVGYTRKYAEELEEQLIIFHNPEYNYHIKSRGAYESVSYFLKNRGFNEEHFRSVLDDKYKVFKDNYTQMGLHWTAQLIDEGRV